MQNPTEEDFSCAGQVHPHQVWKCGGVSLDKIGETIKEDFLTLYSDFLYNLSR